MGVPGDTIRFADLNGDGRDDYLAVADNGAVDAWLNGGGKKDDWVWSPQGTIATGVGEPRSSIRFADLNGDGFDDYLAVAGNGAMSPWLNIGAKPGGWLWYPKGVVATGVGAPGTSIRFAELNGDRRADYVVVDPQSGALRAWLN